MLMMMTYADQNRLWI